MSAGHPNHSITDRKKNLRRILRERRRALTPERAARLSAQVAAHLAASSFWTSATQVGLYWANDGEVDTAPIATRARDAGKTIYLPVLRDQLLHFVPWHGDAALVTNRYGIPEPAGTSVDPASLDLVLVPLVGWSLSGDRLGMGGGFYDRFLAQAGARSLRRLGLAYEIQREDSLDQLREPWDAPLDGVITEMKVYRF